MFFTVAMGFSLHNSIGVLEGHFGKKSEFIRTPKFNVQKLKGSWKKNKYFRIILKDDDHARSGGQRSPREKQ